MRVGVRIGTNDASSTTEASEDMSIGIMSMLVLAVAVIALVAYVLSPASVAQMLRGASSAHNFERDPVCAMKVDIRRAVGWRQRAGQTFWFCSLRCRDMFDAHPDDYAKAEARAVERARVEAMR